MYYLCFGGSKYPIILKLQPKGFLKEDNMTFMGVSLAYSTYYDNILCRGRGQHGWDPAMGASHLRPFTSKLT